MTRQGGTGGNFSYLKNLPNKTYVPTTERKESALQLNDFNLTTTTDTL